MSKEIKVGLLAVVALVALAIGFNFLRGSNLLSSDHTFYAVYPSVNGLNVGAPIMLNGIKVGQVKNLELEPKNGNSVKVALEMEKGIQVGDSTTVRLVGSLLGSTTLTLTLGNSDKQYSGGETLLTTSAQSLSDIVQARAKSTLDTVNATLSNLKGFLNKDTENSIQGTLEGARGSTVALQRLIASNQANINAITRNLAQMSSALNKSTGKLDKIANNFSVLSDSLKNAPVGPALRRLNNTMAEAQQTMAGVNKALTDQKGSLGKLINDTTLYTNLNATAASSNALITDFKVNPKRYVHFSVFGGGSKDKTSKTTVQPNGAVTTKTETTPAPALVRP